jgi:hypothetical protein
MKTGTVTDLSGSYGGMNLKNLHEENSFSGF